jgi:hypothetical protein
MRLLHLCMVAAAAAVAVAASAPHSVRSFAHFDAGGVLAGVVGARVSPRAWHLASACPTRSTLRRGVAAGQWQRAPAHSPTSLTRHIVSARVRGGLVPSRRRGRRGCARAVRVFPYLPCVQRSSGHDHGFACGHAHKGARALEDAGEVRRNQKYQVAPDGSFVSLEDADLAPVCALSSALPPRPPAHRPAALPPSLQH